LREVCVNAGDVVRAIKNAFPRETNESLSRRAGVSFQTVQRWIGSGRADGTALRRLLAAFPLKAPKKRVYLDEAAPKQLYDRCAAVGWDLVIQAGKADTPCL
jgi:transposase